MIRGISEKSGLFHSIVSIYPAAQIMDESESARPMAEEVCSNNKNDSVKMQSCDGGIFEVEREVASTSGLILLIMRDLGSSNITIPLPLVSASTLRLVIQYCRYHVLDAPTTSLDAVKTWDEEFVRPLIHDRAILFEVTKAANYLVIRNLLDLMCQTIADIMQGQTVEEMRELFNIQKEN